MEMVFGSIQRKDGIKDSFFSILSLFCGPSLRILACVSQGLIYGIIYL